MRTLIIKEGQAGKRIDKVIKDAFPYMPISAMHKAFRKKDIKVNGVRVKDDHVVAAGEKLEVYIVDSILDGIPSNTECQLNKGFSIVYEDHNVLIANKEQGVAVHPDREQSHHTLIDLVQSYLKEKGEYDPDTAEFHPSLCHRLDRNTGGLILTAKNNETLRTVIEKMKSNEIRKYYQCLVKGELEKPSATLKAYLIKDEKKSRVFVNDKPAKGSVEIITKYKVLKYQNDISFLEVELVTGRTHQIRAHLAHIGHPIIGDGKYGLNTINRSYSAKYQSLWAYKIVFDFEKGGILNYLKGRKFEVIPEFKINF